MLLKTVLTNLRNNFMSDQLPPSNNEERPEISYANSPISERVITPRDRNEAPKANDALNSPKLSFGMKFNLFIENNRIVITSLVFGVLASVVVLGTYVGFIAPRINKTIATVDIQTLMQEVTLSTFKDMTGLSPDKQADLAKNNITQAGHRMEQALAIISERNHVVLVQKQALAFDKNVPDFTDEVRNALKVSK